MLDWIASPKTREGIVSRINLESVVAAITFAGVVALFCLVGPAYADAGGALPRKTKEHAQVGGPDFQITTVSARNDMISGGDVLVQVDVAHGIPINTVGVSLNGQDVSAAFRAIPATQSLLGLVTGLSNGDNTLQVFERNQRGSASTRLTLTNWPISGPIFSGPHEQPFFCMTHQFTLPITGGNLGPAQDANCFVPSRVDYVYRSTANTFRALPNPQVRPADLQFTTNNEGRNVAYIVRVETGTVNRAIYQIAMLHDPMIEASPDPWTRSRGWNGRLVYQFGGGCPGGWYIQGNRINSESSILEHPMLSLGFATASSTLNRFANNCNDLLATETMMMVRERFIERYGRPAHTIGWGCSGGSYQVHQIGDNYPGLLDGIVAACSFPEVTFAAMTVHSFGAKILRNYFLNNSGVFWTQDEQVAVSGFPNFASLEVQGTRPDRIDPRGDCNAIIPVALLYDPATNPTGVRCAMYEHTRNVYGTDPTTGFARRPLDNVGVQYGLAALNTGNITKAQFLDLNERIGGIDADAGFSSARTVADPIAVRRGYESGRILDGGNGLATMPIIDYRAYADFDNGDPHMRFHSFSTRARLQARNGYSGNQVMLQENLANGLFNTRSPVVREALRQMDQWLLNIAQSASNVPQATKVVQSKPADLVDACFDALGMKIAEPQVYRGATTCNQLYPAHASPYLVAGMPLANNVVICSKKAVNAADYAVSFTPEETKRLRDIFPDGVCDYSKQGHEQRPLLDTWLSFGPAGIQGSDSK